MMRILINHNAASQIQGRAPDRSAEEFHKRLPDYFRTPLIHLKKLTQKYGVGEIYLKDESHRLGLPAFKVLGASWAIWRTLADVFGIELSTWNNLEQLRAQIKLSKPFKLVSATDGNHGRAVARMGRILGLAAHIFMPAGTVEARIKAIESEGAEVTVIEGGYDEAVAYAAEEQNDNTFLIQDTSWRGYEQVTRWVIEGYSTMLWEIEDASLEKGIREPDLVIVQIGVGALAAAVTAHYKRKRGNNPRIIGVEPVNAACAMAAMKAGKVVSLTGMQDSIMAGLNCGTLADAAWPIIRQGIDCFLAIDDEWSRRAVRELYNEGIMTSESGAAGLAGLMAMLVEPEGENCRRYLNMNRDTSVLLILTEGITDPKGFRLIVDL